MKKIIIFLFLLLINIAPVKAEIKLEKCIDGDTADLKIDNEIKKVRFLAIDTPETKHPTKGEEKYGKEASAYTCDKLTNAKKIELTYDDGSNKEDKYGRILAWVFVDDELLQAKLIREGLAKVAYIYGDYQYTDMLKKIEKDAQKRKINIWSEEEEENYNKEEAKKEKKSKEENNHIYIFTLSILVVILCLTNKKYRNKTIKKIKKQTQEEINKNIKKMFK